MPYLSREKNENKLKRPGLAHFYILEWVIRPHHPPHGACNADSVGLPQVCQILKRFNQVWQTGVSDYNQINNSVIVNQEYFRPRYVLGNYLEF